MRVEVLVVGARGGVAFVRPSRGDLPADTHPDARARELAAARVNARPVAVPDGPGGAQCDGPQPVWAPPPLTILHSTSWRYAKGGIILTYVAAFDGRPEPDAEPLGPHGIARSGDPVVPSPPEICPDAVATHALRHLAWLRGTDEAVATALAALPELWRALDAYVPGPAGALIAAR